MSVDRATKVLLAVIAVALTAIAVNLWLGSGGLGAGLGPGPAQAQPAARYEVSVPKAWGKLVGFSSNNLLLESAEGLRIVDVEGKAPEYPKIKVFVRWQ